MQFFYEAVLEVNKTHQGTLNPDAESGTAESTEKGEGSNQGDGDTGGTDTGRIRATVWLDAVYAVSDLTKYDWQKVFEMSAMEFFVFLSYSNYRVRRQEAEIRKIQKHK